MRSSRLMMIKKRQALEESNATKTGFNSEERNPYFFKIIVSPLAQKSSLRIPVGFVKKYGEQLSDDIFLNVPNSEKPWKVEIKKENTDMSLGKGWQDFMEFYSLEYGHLLVFRLDGGLQSHFYVLILDKSGTEIDYPVRSSHVSNRSADSRLLKRDVTEDHSHHTEETDDVSLETLDESSPKINTFDSVINLDTSDSDDDVEGLSFKSKGNDEISPEMRKKNLKKKLDSLKSQYPHFKSIICPTHVHNKYILSVPFNSHASTYFPSDKSEKIILKGPTGKSHAVGYYFGKKHAQLISGWKYFVLDNDLKVGDACMFELVSRKPNFYKVSIYRG
ncbi:B3 domain-containing transcription factor VRN1-like [Chenopodium quinoa]|uniref:B3 domain-containing transcription factor VRN1-like n=1 Tax=Chenopodium quinoa TaxID=63459 RepID=UPI000B781ACA|nr:B3 domain-containing transcription factor VRN1-like [Chenopodium quinoa]